MELLPSGLLSALALYQVICCFSVTHPNVLLPNPLFFFSLQPRCFSAFIYLSIPCPSACLILPPVGLLLTHRWPQGEIASLYVACLYSFVSLGLCFTLGLQWLQIPTVKRNVPKSTFSFFLYFCKATYKSTYEGIITKHQNLKRKWICPPKLM